MPATQEKPNATHIATEAWMQMLSNVCWTQEQGEKMIQTMLEQGRVTREESLRMADAMANQVKSNQVELQKWVQSSIQMSMAAFKLPQSNEVEALHKQIAELTKKVEQLSKKG